MNLPKLTDLDVAGKRVLVRLDLDTKPDVNDLRIKSSKETLDYLKEKGASMIIILGHKGRPTGDSQKDSELSLKPFEPLFPDCEVKENLRFNPGEEANEEAFSSEIASWGEIYINEAFASSHREHASIVGVPKLLPHAAGFHFMKEIENLSKVFEPARPLVFVISGVKEDKMRYIKEFEEVADKILIGGKLPDYLGDEKLVSVRSRGEAEKVIVGNLIMDKEDITLNTIERFEEEIGKAGTIVISGPLGKYEDEGHSQGTERVFGAIVNSSALKIAGGGDTEKAIAKLNFSDKFDWISVGGGAMLEFLSKKTLPGIEALLR